MVPDIAKKGHSFAGAFAYYLHDKGAQTADRVAWSETRNLMSDDPQIAKRIMIATAQLSDELKRRAGVKAAGRKSNAHVYAYSLAWHPDEAAELTREEMRRAADASLKELKADHLQAVIVCHTDQKHPHVHIIINRVDPADGRMHGFKNDRLQLSKWANDYERERGRIYTQAREDKRQQRDQEQDRQKRQTYAKQKREEAAAGNQSPFVMLKELGAAQKQRHREEWKALSADNRDRREAIYNHARAEIRRAAGDHKAEMKPIWRAHFKEARERVAAFEARERELLGRIRNAIEVTAAQHIAGQLDGRGQLATTFANMLSADRRRHALAQAIDHDRMRFAASLKAPLDRSIHQLKAGRKAALEANRRWFDQERFALKTRQGTEWDKMGEAWQQLRARTGRGYRSTERQKEQPLKREYDDAAKGKAAPVRTEAQTVNKPAPTPSPAGDVPPSRVEQRTVPTEDKARAWAKQNAAPATPHPLRTSWTQPHPKPAKEQDPATFTKPAGKVLPKTPPQKPQKARVATKRVEAANSAFAVPERLQSVPKAKMPPDGYRSIDTDKPIPHRPPVTPWPLKWSKPAPVAAKKEPDLATKKTANPTWLQKAADRPSGTADKQPAPSWLKTPSRSAEGSDRDSEIQNQRKGEPEPER